MCEPRQRRQTARRRQVARTEREHCLSDRLSSAWATEQHFADVDQRWLGFGGTGAEFRRIRFKCGQRRPELSERRGLRILFVRVLEVVAATFEIGRVGVFPDDTTLDATHHTLVPVGEHARHFFGRRAKPPIRSVPYRPRPRTFPSQASATSYWVLFVWRALSGMWAAVTSTAQARAGGEGCIAPGRSRVCQTNLSFHGESVFDVFPCEVFSSGFARFRLRGGCVGGAVGVGAKLASRTACSAVGRLLRWRSAADVASLGVVADWDLESPADRAPPL